MQAHVTLWSYFFLASFPIKLIVIVLSISSIGTWAFIFHRTLTLKALHKSYKQFEKEFWSDIKLTELYETLPDTIAPEQLSAIFYAGFTEFYRLRNSGCHSLRIILEGVERAMRIAHAQTQIHLERHVHWLAIIASSGPALGLLGTLLGIASTLSFEPISYANTLTLVAPGIAQALTISIFSLLASLPALIFYQSYTAEIDRLLSQYHIFQEEFIALLMRQTYEEQHEKPASN